MLSQRSKQLRTQLRPAHCGVFHARHHLPDALHVPSRCEVDDTLHVVCHLDIHRRGHRFLILLHRHITGFERAVHNVVCVRCAKDRSNRKAHFLRQQPTHCVAAGASRHAEINNAVHFWIKFEVRPDVVRGLGEDAGPVNAVDAADCVGLNEGFVPEELLQHLGLLVRVALCLKYMHIRRVDGRHLHLLDTRDAPLRVEAVNIDVLTPTDRVNRGGSRVTGRLNQDIGVTSFTTEVVVQELRDDLLPDVFERQRGAEARVEEAHRTDAPQRD